MGPEEVRRFCDLDEKGRRLLDAAYERLGLSARAFHRILKCQSCPRAGGTKHSSSSQLIWALITFCFAP